MNPSSADSTSPNGGVGQDDVEARLARRYPRLHAPQRWAWGGMDARFSTRVPEDRLVTNIHLIGFAPLGQDGADAARNDAMPNAAMPNAADHNGAAQEGVVLCRDDRDHWFLPGGTREEAESVEACLARELREEAGARLLGEAVWIGAHRCVTDHPTPYRPWQPHPEKAWLWGWGEVVVDSEPDNPEDGESVVEVRVVPPTEAQRLLTRGRDGWWAELVALAVESRAAAQAESHAGARTPRA